MSFWNQATVEPKRSFRWLLYISGMPQFIVTKVKKPSFRIGNTPHNFLNYEFKYPGRVSWQDINFTVVDPVDPDSTASLFNILEAAGYRVPSAYEEANARTVSKEGLVNSLGGQIRIVQLDADGNTEDPLESWVINNPQITTVDFGDLDYSQEGMVNIAVTVAYDWATLETGGRAKKKWALNPGAEFTDDDEAG
tara:strand:- start:894 stop:1475 length:582 start_codon:yes stop_codon:yes gene_type:complete